MDLNLCGKVAVVTGASRGIGRTIARELAAEGMSVAIAARDAAALESLAGEIAHAGTGAAAFPFPADLRDPAAPPALVAAAFARFGRIDLLVNNAGATQRGDFLTLPDDAWLDGFALKFFGAARLCRAAWPHLMNARGSIINIAGVGGRTGSAEFAIGGPVNAALLNLTKCLADRGVAEGVRVNAINPGYILTDRLALRVRRLADEQQISEEQAASLMAQRSGIAGFGTPQEIAHAVAFLASDRAAYLQGALLDIDGGMTRTL